MRHTGHRDDERLVELVQVGSQVEVAALLGELQARGINATTSTDDAGGAYPWLSFANGYRVLVLEGDLAPAREIARAVLG